MLDVTAGEFAFAREMDANELSETRRVVVSHGLGVAERLQHGVGLHDLLFQRPLNQIPHTLSTFFAYQNIFCQLFFIYAYLQLFYSE